MAKQSTKQIEKFKQAARVRDRRQRRTLYSNRVKLGITDAMHANKAMQGIVGKRLMYRRASKAEIN
jgi:hypothetical protein